jgi:two-component system, cell cycle sensor histidine kinase and response regulator CckA
MNDTCPLPYPGIDTFSVPTIDRQPCLTSWLDRLTAMARPRPGGPGGPGGPGHDRAADAYVDAQLRHAQKLALAGRLATGLVHDFNNTLLVARACLEVIAEAPGDAAVVRDQAQAAGDALRRSSDLARRLATFGRPDDGTRQRIDVNDIIRSSAQLIEPVAGAGVELTVCCPAHALLVHVDPAQIEQAILNLCLNARDAMPNGGSLRLATHSAVRWSPRDGGNRGRAPVTYAVVEVSDTGTGIPSDLQAVVFEPFFTTKASGDGSGLGLAMVRETALAHGGLVELTSDAEGTAFRILLPLS